MRHKREAAARGEDLVRRVDKYIERQDFPGALNLLLDARRQFSLANKKKRVKDLDAMQMRVRGDQVLHEMNAARAIGNYDQCVDLAKEALEHYTTLAGLTQIWRETSARDGERREKDRRRFKRLRNPRKRVVKFATEDGEKNRDLAEQALQEQQYEEASRHIDNATASFQWAGLSLDSAQTGVNALRDRIDTEYSRHIGLQLLESISLQLEPVREKDFEAIQDRLAHAERAYCHARDEAGKSLVRNLRSCLASLRSGDIAWLGLQAALEAFEYTDATARLIETRGHYAIANESMEKTSLSRILNLMADPEMCIAKFAKQDGDKFRRLGEASLRETPPRLAEARSYVFNARKAYNWVAAQVKRRKQKKAPPLQHPLTGAGFAPQGDGDGDGDGDGGGAQTLSAERIKAGEQLLRRFFWLFKKNAAHTAFGAGMAQTFDSVCPSLDEDLQDLNQLENKIQRADALEQGEELLRQFYEAVNIDPHQGIAILDEAIHIYRQGGFAEKAEDVTHLQAHVRGEWIMTQIFPGHLSIPDVGELLKEESLDEKRMPEQLASEREYAKALNLLYEAKRHFEDAKDQRSVQHVQDVQDCMYGDQVMQDLDSKLQQRDYDTALVVANNAKRYYERSGNCARQRRGRIHDPFILVCEHATRGGEDLCAEVVDAIKQKETAKARELAAEARRCYEWAGKDTRSIRALETAITMTEVHKQGDDVMTQVRSTLKEEGNGGSNTEEMLSVRKAMSLLQEAKQFYSEAQMHYQALMEEAAALVEGDQCEKALALQDHINAFYSVVDDGNCVGEVEAMHSCLVSDKSLDKLESLIAASLYNDAQALLLAADRVYERAQAASSGAYDTSDRRDKVKKISEYVKSIEQYERQLKNKAYSAAVELLSEAKQFYTEASRCHPRSLYAPFADALGDCESVGREAAENCVLNKANEAGDNNQREALKCLDRGDFERALFCANEARRSYEWAKAGRVDDWENQSGISELTNKIMTQKALRLGDTCMKEVDKALESRRFSDALELLREVHDHFADANADDRLEEVRKLVACTQGKQAMDAAATLDDKKDFAAALRQLEVAINHFGNASDKAQIATTTRLHARVRGDLIMQEFVPALEKKEYDSAVEIMNRATEAYRESEDAAKLGEVTSSKARVRQYAIQDGDKIKARAVLMLTKQKKIEESELLLAQAVTCYSWAQADLDACGITALRADIDKAEARKTADGKWKQVMNLVATGDCRSALTAAEEVEQLYRSAGAPKLQKDVQKVQECLRCDLTLDRFAELVVAEDIQGANEMMERTKQIYQQAYDSAAMGKWKHSVGARLEMVNNASCFLAAWSDLSSATGDNDAQSRMSTAFEALEHAKKQYPGVVQLPIQCLNKVLADCPIADDDTGAGGDYEDEEFDT